MKEDEMDGSVHVATARKWGRSVTARVRDIQGQSDDNQGTLVSQCTCFPYHEHRTPITQAVTPFT
jgi:hypothetical protein